MSILEPDLIARFTSHLKEALQKALSFAIGSGRDVVEPGDLLVGLLSEKGSIAAEILSKSQIQLTDAQDHFRGKPAVQEPGAPIAPDLSPTVKRLLEKCILTAHLHEHKYVGTEHLLQAMIDLPTNEVQTFLEEHGMDLEYAREQVKQVLKSTLRFPDLLQQGEEEDPSRNMSAPSAPDAARQRPARERKVRALDAFARELTAPDIVATLDPVIGREEETSRLVEVLCRRTKNNPILLGEPGVGKTAIVEGLAQLLASGEVPDGLQGKRIYAIDLALMVAGTMYRGEFESRLKQLVEEVKNDPDILLFIDEIHNLVGAGSTSGSLDAANMLKPALARGEIHCIGATTWAEYKKHIEPDAALERRYQSISVSEPSAELTRKMLEGLKSRYEDHHGIRYTKEALDAAVSLSERHLADRFFPDKAIDVLDEAAALVSSTRRSDETMERARALEIAITATRESKEQAVEAGNMDDAAQALEDEERLLQEKNVLEEASRATRKRERAEIGIEYIAKVISRHARVPLRSILSEERERLRDLEANLLGRIFGQNAAVQGVSDTVRKARLGLSDPRRPRASFLFVGPSGVGKTELATSLAKELFGKEDALIKLDMSEFAEGHAVSKLLGSPAGYVGYREQSRLIDTIRKHPHSVLLFDEFEKAHPDVQHLLLQVLEDGKMSDATGRPVSFRHAYIVLTSNVGSEYVNQSHIGFTQEASPAAFETHVREQLKERFRPELLNRIDRIAVFQPLDKTALKEIIRKELTVIFERLSETQRVAVSAGDDVLEWLLSQEMNVEEGARAARRIIERDILSLLGEELVKHPKKRRGTLKVSKDKLRVT